MMVRLESGGNYTTYTCRHVNITEVRPGTPAAERGMREGITVDAIGVVSVTFEVTGEDVVSVTSETRPRSVEHLHLPTDGEAIYLMDDRRQTTKILYAFAEAEEAAS